MDVVRCTYMHESVLFFHSPFLSPSLALLPSTLLLSLPSYTSPSHFLPPSILPSTLPSQQVNADIKKFIIEEHGAPRLFEVNTSIVGKTISTKALGSTSREDVTDQVRLSACVHLSVYQFINLPTTLSSHN